MSMEDAERFVRSAGADKELAGRIKVGATGLASLVEIGRAGGYTFTVEELKALLDRAPRRQLTDQELNEIAGGIEIFAQPDGSIDYRGGDPSGLVPEMPRTTTTVVVTAT